MTIKFTPTADMSVDNYPPITAKLTALGGTNDCTVIGNVDGPVFEVLPSSQEHTTEINFGAYHEFDLTVKNTGAVSGTVRLKILGDGWTLIPTAQPDPVWTLAPNASGAFKARFTGNSAAFQNVLNKISGKTYMFIGTITGDGMYAKPASCSVKCKFTDSATARFSTRPNGGNVFVPVTLPNLTTSGAAGHFVQTTITVYNIGSAFRKTHSSL